MTDAQLCHATLMELCISRSKARSILLNHLHNPTLRLRRVFSFNIMRTVIVFIILFVSRTTAESHDIGFQLGEAGQVSVAVYDAQGRLSRELSRGAKREPGDY